MPQETCLKHLTQPCAAQLMTCLQITTAPLPQHASCALAHCSVTGRTLLPVTSPVAAKAACLATGRHLHPWPPRERAALAHVAHRRQLRRVLAAVAAAAHAHTRHRLRARHHHRQPGEAGAARRA